MYICYVTELQSLISLKLAVSADLLSPAFGPAECGAYLVYKTTQMLITTSLSARTHSLFLAGKFSVRLSIA